MIRTLLALALVTSLSVPALAQDDDADVAIDDTPAADGRIATQLDELGVAYEIDDEGDYRVVLRFDEEKRSQVAYVNSETVDFNDMEIREVWSPAYRQKGELSAAMANRLLAASFDAPLGAWQVARLDDGTHVVIFCVKVAANCDAATLDRVLATVVAAADDMEREISGKDEM